MIIKTKKIHENATLPTMGTEYAAGNDLYACLDEQRTIPAGRTAKIGTGICVEIPEGFFGGVFARSGLATKQGLRPVNCVGVIDSDYRGEIIVALHNDSSEDRIIQNGDRIAQLIILPYLVSKFELSEELSDTVRGSDGFGSTGTN